MEWNVEWNVEWNMERPITSICVATPTYVVVRYYLLHAL